MLLHNVSETRWRWLGQHLALCTMDGIHHHVSSARRVILSETDALGSNRIYFHVLTAIKSEELRLHKAGTLSCSTEHMSLPWNSTHQTTQIQDTICDTADRHGRRQYWQDRQRLALRSQTRYALESR